jgi:hypothetical protein
VTRIPAAAEISRADAQEREALHRFLRGKPHLHDADDEAADQVDAGDEDARHGVAAHELARAVHRSVKIGLALDRAAAVARLALADDASVEVGIDAHLLAGHGVEGEAGGNFRDAARALRDDDEIDDRQDDEDHQSDDEVALHHELPECADEVARVALGQDRAGGGDVEAEPEQGDEQEQGREDAEVGRLLDAGDQHDDEHGQRDAEGEQRVDHPGRQRQDEDEDDGQHPEREEHVAPLQDRADLESTFFIHQSFSVFQISGSSGVPSGVAGRVSKPSVARKPWR